MHLVQWLRAHASQGPAERTGSSARAEAGAPAAATATTGRGQPSSRRRVGDADQRFGQAVGMGVFGVREPRDRRPHAQQVGDREAVGRLCGKKSRPSQRPRPIRPSSTPLQRQIKLRAASSFGQPRSIGRRALAGRPRWPCFPHVGSRSCRQSWRRSGGQESTRRPIRRPSGFCEQRRSRRPEPSVSVVWFLR